MNAVAYFEIQATRPDAAIAFYRAAFGWTFTRQEGIPIPYWRIETGGIRGGLLQRPAKTPPPECGTNAFVCSIEVPDIDATIGRSSRSLRAIISSRQMMSLAVADPPGLSMRSTIARTARSRLTRRICSTMVSDPTTGP